MKRVRLLAILNSICLLAQILCSYGMQLGFWGPETMASVSNRYPSLFTPAGSTFAIWGLIYTTLAALCVRHLLAAFRYPLEQECNQETIRMGPFFALNNLLAGAWVIAWSRLEIGVCLGLMLAQLITLIIIHFRLDIHTPERSPGSVLITQVPLSIYFGWITVATIANTAIYLVSVNWEGAGMDFSAATWTLAVIALAVFVNILVIFTRRNIAFGLVLIWALWGIVREQQDTDQTLLRDAARLSMAVIAVTCLIQLILDLLTRHRRLRTVTETPD